MTFLAAALGIFGVLMLPTGGIFLLMVCALLCARESHRLRNLSQLDDWRWEVDLAGLRRAAYAYKAGKKSVFLRPRRFYDPR
ncbi:MAG: hypothetical protein HOC91_18390 [Nitrospinaceae bacterium]|nr:hypothetical protein [Nitrospinaceae bacterium]MBT3434784.1 hypothetical protein [Nitrospinaceae bacterium]MBT3820961.1 hypothetical protein [Nitrospinaceae bacterium]MBT4094743.1 hypothetical protein [Nitrospinaceae bacterium]MBT4432483.1 hypothetical protein [Nitrospinaceae bacterium]